MRAPISVIIPTLNAADTLPDCLAALGEGLAAGLIRELIIADGGSEDQTLAIAEAAGAEIATGPRGRGGQLRRGCAVAAGDWLMILHADSVLRAGWTEPVMRHLPEGGPAAFNLRFRARGLAPRIVAGWANLRSRLFALPYGDQCLLVSRADYVAAGGYADIPLMEDVALIRRLPQVRLLPATVETGAERYEREGWMRRGLRNHWTMIRYSCGVSPEQLVKDYERK